MDAASSACFAVFTILGRMSPTAAPGQLKYAFLAIGAILVGYQVIKEYRRYKKSLIAR